MKAYSDLKVIHDLDRISKLKSWRNQPTSDPLRKERPSPGQVQLILSDTCNHNCSFCAYRLDGYSSNENFADEMGNSNPKRMIPEEKAIEIVTDCAAIGVQGVQFTGGGEPTVHPGHLRIMRHALDLGLACGLVTNGNLLRPGWEDVLPRFRWVRVSMDAGNAKDYAAIREIKEGQWDKMLANIRKMADAGVPNLGTSFIVTKENLGGVRDAAVAAHKAGATYFRIGAFYNPLMEKYYNVNDELRVRDQIAWAKKDVPEDFIHDMFTKRLEYMSRKPTFEFCGYQHLNVYVGGDQKVYRCCEYAYNDHGFLGDLRGQTFKQWWDSQEADEKYKCFDARKCVTCPFHSKNELTEFMTRGDISEMHPEFP